MRNSAGRYVARVLVSAAAIAAAIAGGCAAAQENSPGGPDKSNSCANLGQYIFVGGTGGFNSLRHGALFAELLQTGRVGLYEHASAISAAQKPAGLLTDIKQVFHGTGPGQAEFGQVGANYFTLPPSYGFYKKQYVQNGLRPAEANVNTPSDSAAPGQLQADVRLWKEYVDAARSVGIASVAPIVGPNAADEPKLGENVFVTNPFYELERDEALYGKAMAFDVPPNFFLSGGSGPGYEKFIVQAIQWGNAHRLRTTMLVSPYPWPTNSAGRPVMFRQFTDNTFDRDTQEFVRRLTAEDAVPSEWAVDDYEDTYPLDAPAMVPETVQNTATEVGLWLARNAPVYVRQDDAEDAICFPPPLAGAANPE
ncbi:MAG TPA: hypothetical protein VGP48_10280 [Stellaceae bacterium]|jgi:hypothetical protein|nr:hypothetical protein [Stellaceae bacterium]